MYCKTRNWSCNGNGDGNGNDQKEWGKCGDGEKAKNRKMGKNFQNFALKMLENIQKSIFCQN
jgi:hypothetical protein